MSNGEVFSISRFTSSKLEEVGRQGSAYRLGLWSLGAGLLDGLLDGLGGLSGGGCGWRLQDPELGFLFGVKGHS